MPEDGGNPAAATPQEAAAAATPQEEGGRLGHVLAARRQAMARLRDRGIEPFALSFAKDADIAEVVAEFGALEAGAQPGAVRSVAGRVIQRRVHGKLAFVVIRDRSGDLQLFLGQDFTRPESWALLEELDLADIVGATGDVMKTRRGELSLKVDELLLLTKSLRPPPEKWHGLRDPELRVRRRYVQLAHEPEYREVVRARAKVLEALRSVLDSKGFLEVETPVLQVTPGGALARPFVTHHNVLDVDMYLRIAPELYLKRLLVGGLERVYEIGRNFRNEGIDRDHNPEFTMLEAYQAYGDYEDMMRLVEELTVAAAMAVRGTLRFEYLGRELNVEPPWPRRALVEVVSEAVGEEVSLERDDLNELADRLGVYVDPGWGPGKVIVELYEKLVEEDIWDPVFVKDFPREVSPLARPHRSAPGFTEHFDAVICGTELGPSYSELTDPDEQRARFLDQVRQRQRGDDEAHVLDEDFLEALEHGMPPAGGMGYGVDRVLMILTDQPSIRDVITFPHLRPEEGRS